MRGAAFLLVVAALDGCSKKDETCGETAKTNFSARLKEYYAENAPKDPAPYVRAEWQAALDHALVKVETRFSRACNALDVPEKTASSTCFARKSEAEATCTGPWRSGSVCGETCKSAFQTVKTKIESKENYGPSDLATKGKPQTKLTHAQLKTAFEQALPAAKKDPSAEKTDVDKVVAIMKPQVGPPIETRTGKRGIVDAAWFYIDGTTCRSYSLTGGDGISETDGPGDMERCWRP